MLENTWDIFSSLGMSINIICVGFIPIFGYIAPNVNFKILFKALIETSSTILCARYYGYGKVEYSIIICSTSPKSLHCESLPLLNNMTIKVNCIFYKVLDLWVNLTENY